MSWTQSDLDALEEALASGLQSVAYRDRTVTYRSVDEMIRLREIIRRKLKPSGLDDRAVYASTDKGLD